MIYCLKSPPEPVGEHYIDIPGFFDSIEGVPTNPQRPLRLANYLNPTETKPVGLATGQKESNIPSNGLLIGPLASCAAVVVYNQYTRQYHCHHANGGNLSSGFQNVILEMQDRENLFVLYVTPQQQDDTGFQDQGYRDNLQWFIDNGIPTNQIAWIHGKCMHLAIDSNGQFSIL